MRAALSLTVATALTLAAALCLCGCGGGERYITEEQANKVEAPLAPASHFQLPDIPVPALLSFDRRKSLISEKPQARSASLHYRGRVHIDRVVNFFRDHMRGTPGWKLQDDRMRGSRHVLEFIKGRERATVTIEKGGISGVRVIVDVN
jgi:hypothetical protein